MTERLTFKGTDGLTLVASASGPADGFPVLLAHGPGGQTRRAWRGTVSALAEQGFRAVAIDLRGHGESDWAPESALYDSHCFAQDMMAVADQLGRPPAMVGASLGGMAGLLAEGHHAQGSFGSLTLVDIAASVSESGVDEIVGFMASRAKTGFASPDEAASAIADYMPNRPRRGASESLTHYLRKGDDGRYRWHWDPGFIDGIARDRTIRPAQMQDAARALKLPVHLVRGRQSNLLTVEGAQDFLAMVPHAEFTRYCRGRAHGGGRSQRCLFGSDYRLPSPHPCGGCCWRVMRQSNAALATANIISFTPARTPQQCPDRRRCTWFPARSGHCGGAVRGPASQGCARQSRQSGGRAKCLIRSR